MTIRTTYAAESWDKVYNAFQQINFTSYDYDTIKESLLQYLKIYHAEHFNDFIESSELVAMLELFAYVAELLAYRVDAGAHENFMTTAQRKQSILRLARLVSYRASRNIPARGLVKIGSIRTSETVFDSLGNNLANVTVTWNDANNSNWKEQFFLVMNKVLTSKVGQPSKSFQISDVLMQIYTFNNDTKAFKNGVSPVTASSSPAYQLEVTPIDIDANGPFERMPDPNSQFSVVYASDGQGEGSDYTGFLMFIKQGNLIKTDYTITDPIANRRIELDAINVNDTDVWLQRIDDDAIVTEVWKRVETLQEQNLSFNDDTSTRKKYELETLENDRVAFIFGDNNFSDAPVGRFNIWTRISANENVNIPKNAIVDKRFTFTYTNRSNNSFEFNCTFSLTAALQNNAPSETIEHIRQSAPSTYYAQNRMVNGQDYNTFPLKDQSILRLKSINRTFAGQPKFIEWNDASGQYENIKLFGNDLQLFLDSSSESTETRSSGKTIIDSFIEPLLQTNALLTTLTHVCATSEYADGIVSYPRRKFIEDSRQIYFNVDEEFVTPYGKDLDGNPILPGHPIDGSLTEKTAIQSAVDRHWYGDPTAYATINGVRHAVVKDPLIDPSVSSNIYAPDIPRTIDGINTYPPGDSGSGLQQIESQPQFGLRFNRFLKALGTSTIELFEVNSATSSGAGPALAEGLINYADRKEVLTIEAQSDGTTFTVNSNLRGVLPNYSASSPYTRWSGQTDVKLPIDFSIYAQSAVAGDAFIIDITYSPNNASGVCTAKLRTFGKNDIAHVNLSGWWELIPYAVIASPIVDGGAAISVDGPTLAQQMTFDNADIPTAASLNDGGVPYDQKPLTSNPNSWIFLLSRKTNSSGEIESYTITNRNMRIMCQSQTTKFWYQQDTQILDSETKKPVLDKIRILRSNLDEYGMPLKKALVYDVVAAAYDTDGNLISNRLELLPTGASTFTSSMDGAANNILQFESFSKDSYQYGEILNNEITWFGCVDGTAPLYQIVDGYDTTPFDGPTYDFYGIIYNGYEYRFTPGNMIGQLISNDPAESEFAPVVVRRRMTPPPIAPDEDGCNLITGLDFMWQHFSPATHLVDPSVTNIHDMFLMTRGYYSNMSDYVKGFINYEPTPPTPLELRTSYGYLLNNKMLSDTVVLHSGKIKLLFGALAGQTLRAKFKVVKSTNASFSDERIKTEIIDVIDVYFDIQNWDFGDKFYATELISLIHQRLGSQISSVVLVPSYSVNSFGSLFTIDSGFDEILQSAANLNDVEIVPALTSTVLRQIR